MFRSLSTVGRISALLAVGASALVAQGTQVANINGEVLTRDGAPVAGVTVRLTSPSMQGIRTVTTDAKGRFAGRLLPPGTYTIVLNKDGMQQVKATAVLALGTTFEPRYQMAPVGGTIVEVVSSVGDIDKSDSKTATNYDLGKVDQLPTGRTMEGVALLTPGVTVGVGNRVQIRGAMTSGNLYLLDGQNISDNAYNNKGVRTIDDSIEEIQVITGAISSEYGDVDGGVMNAITKSGSNEFEGQLRWEISNSAWNSLQRYQNVNALPNKMNEEKTLTLSGFIIKDKLWFAAGYFTTEQTGSGTIGYDLTGLRPGAGNGPGGFNSSYDTYTKEIRRNIKLTWSLNQNHTLISSFVNSHTDDRNRNYRAAEVSALVPQVSTSQFWNLQWRAIWSNSLTSEAKIGVKNQKLSAGASPEGGSPLYNYDNGGGYNNGIFNSTDGGDNRDNKTFNAKVSYFLDAMGSHQFDFGVDYYKGISKARNEQTPTGFTFGVQAVDMVSRTAVPYDIWVYTSTEGEAVSETAALYINDKWNMNRHLSFNIGLRFDRFQSKNEQGQSTAKATGLSPRLGMKYDLLGDAKYVFGASYAKYNGKASTNVLNSVTGQGNPTEIDHPWIGDGLNSAGTAYLRLRHTFAEITNLANAQTNYNFNRITYYDNPTINVKLADDLKAPSVAEYQASFQYSFTNPNIGMGSIKVTGVSKTWNDLLDYRVGQDGTVVTPAGNAVYNKVWYNSDLAERKYKGLELETQLTKGAWTVGGNATWSELKGNYEGEGSNTPGRGEGLENYTIMDGVYMYDSNVINAPYGYLSGHVPLRIRANASYVNDNAFGRTTWGLIYRFDSGARYSTVRNVSREEVNLGLPEAFSSTSSQYLGERGGAGSFDSLAYLDVAVTHDFPIFKAYGKTVRGFAKLVITNVFNHQQIYSWATGYDAAIPDPVTGGTSAGYGLNSPWVRASNYGTTTSNLQMGAARRYAISAGIRF